MVASYSYRERYLFQTNLYEILVSVSYYLYLDLEFMKINVKRACGFVIQSSVPGKFHFLLPFLSIVPPCQNSCHVIYAQPLGLRIKFSANLGLSLINTMSLLMLFLYLIASLPSFIFLVSLLFPLFSYLSHSFLLTLQNVAYFSDF